MSGHQRGDLLRGAGWFGIGIGLGATIVGLSSVARTADRTVTIKTSVTIRRDALDIYNFWRDFSNIPRFMRHVEKVTESSGKVSRWSARGPAGTTLEWEADIVSDRAGDRIAWRSKEGATFANHGAVLFRAAPKGRGTEVHLTIGFEPPGGAVAAKFLRLFETVPEIQLKNDLRRLKQLLETGEVMRSDASIHRRAHSARPPSVKEFPSVERSVQS